MTGKKYEPPLHLDIDFAEALERFGVTDKQEADELIERAKKEAAEGQASGGQEEGARPRLVAAPPISLHRDEAAILDAEVRAHIVTDPYKQSVQRLH
ncbi:hypothetical protein RFM26_24910 [Mesorhizobium sp. VK23B]|uniref:Uncharacterized protein n=1 Tax=Mesorhizobium dulcispinae TaxID=3072316 RepID=A0ABU4XKI9_9HYPH|nr:MULTISPECIES: hypothetical protein [unclassified Mesorhizobium]MDX8468954.1 hypothetical protein [Mesorhizobium sp. VK23B]MDX8475257.1 hypothetical protein [Mesorhizobium sp. VK23A]